MMEWQVLVYVYLKVWMDERDEKGSTEEGGGCEETGTLKVEMPLKMRRES
jgi:hypothetical protein